MKVKKMYTFCLKYMILVCFSLPCQAQTSKSFQLKKWSIASGGGTNQSFDFQIKESAFGGIAIGTCTCSKFILNGSMLISSVKDSSLIKPAVPSMFRLLQNYPNPFNPTTTIHYTLPGASDVKIQIFNSVGQLIRNLEQKSQQPGGNQVIWDGRNDQGQPVPSGLYYYQIVSDGFKEVRKMTLLK